MATAVDRPCPADGAVGREDEFGVQIAREWLLTNGRGGYSSGTAIGVPTRRYHGLLIASARPPLDRWLLLSSVLERVAIDGQVRELAAFEFEKAVHPQGYRLQTGFAVSNDPQTPWVRFDYQADEMRVTKRILMPRGQDEVWIAYRVNAPAGAAIELDLLPFVPMRDYHATTHAFEGGFAVHQAADRAVVEAYPGGPRLNLHVERADNGEPAHFEHRPDWWYGFVYRAEVHRGFSDREDLFVPGFFRVTGRSAVELVLRASAQFSPVVENDDAEPSTGVSGSSASRHRRGSAATLDAHAVVDLESRTSTPQGVEARLCNAADAFVVRRRRADGSHSATILAGYHWFGDWGRDAFIALPGLLLETQRFDEAREVLETFASAQKDGLIPNRFSDYGDGCDYNSVDASLWYLHGAVAYLQASGDHRAWRDFLGHACDEIVEGFVRGTRFNIHLDSDGLVTCGDHSTQLTWMDAKYGDIVFTPRHGKPVEINALWYHGLVSLAAEIEDDDPRLAGRYRSLAERAGEAFRGTFWNPAGRCLYDVVRDDERDDAIRPNQIFAVSLPHSPLDDLRRRAVVSCVECELLTPFGLRSLSPRDPRYRGRYEGSPFERDGAYHQGTVWSWLIGPYIEAYLRVHDFSPAASGRARQMLMPLIDHLDDAGIGSVSEIFDGEPPHTPRGCIAQAWSVGELLRAWRLTETR